MGEPRGGNPHGNADANSSPSSRRELEATQEAVNQLARRVRYLETLPLGTGGGASEPDYVKLWMGAGEVQVVPTDTDTLLYFTDNEKTEAGYVDGVVSPYVVLTVPSGLSGIHTVSAGARFQGDPTGQRRLWVMVNGIDGGDGDELVAMQVDAADGEYFATELNVSAPAWLWEGYFVEAWVYQNSGGNLEVGQVELAGT